MIIDFHAHLMSPKLMSTGYWDNWVRLSSILSGRPAASVREKLPQFWDETGDMLIADMNAAGIDCSVISAIDYGLANNVGEAAYSILEINRLFSEVARIHTDRLVYFAGVDPRRSNALDTLKTCIKEFGANGIKLLPPTGFYPNDKAFYPIYHFANDNGLPVLVHTGPETPPLYSKYCSPIFVDDVAADFPDLKIILGHAGFCWWPEALNLATTKPNFYLDLAGWQPRAAIRTRGDEFYKPIRIMIDSIGADRLLFGSDWPALRLFKGGQTNWVKIFRELPESAKASGINFTKEEVDSILGGTAARILAEQKS